MKKAKFNFLFMAAIAAALMVSAQEEAESAPESVATVVATELAQPYVYVQLDIDGELKWFAAPETVYSIGEEIVPPAGGLPMKNFYSKALDRTFDMVYFVGSLTRVNEPEEEALPPGHPPLGDSDEPAVPETFDFSGIERPADGINIGEVYAKKSELAGENVVVRGIAVKVSTGILGKNWIHLQDGSGEKGSDDLLVTTTKEVEVGATITVHGTVMLDQDFGAGYQYDVMLEATEILLN